jgi:plastocyanin
MHAAALHLAPILGAEKSKTPFYIAGGLLVLWALFISLGVGMRKPDFPANLGQQRAVMAISAVLVAAAVSMAVVTSGGEDKASAKTTTTAPGAEAPPAAAGSETSPATSTPATAPAPSATTSLKLAANPGGELSYDTKALSAKAGTVTITMTNMSPVEHNVTVAEGSKVLGATPSFVGGTKTLTLSLKAGTYTFYCSVPGHRQAGMEGTLTVS